MKNLIRTVFLTIAIYSGAVAANSDDVNIIGGIIMWYIMFSICINGR